MEQSAVKEGDLSKKLITQMNYKYSLQNGQEVNEYGCRLKRERNQFATVACSSFRLLSYTLSATFQLPVVF